MDTMRTFYESNPYVFLITVPALALIIYTVFLKYGSPRILARKKQSKGVPLFLGMLMFAGISCLFFKKALPIYTIVLIAVIILVITVVPLSAVDEFNDKSGRM
jgi:hypothetical protein